MPLPVQTQAQDAQLVSVDWGALAGQALEFGTEVAEAYQAGQASSGAPPPSAPAAPAQPAVVVVPTGPARTPIPRQQMPGWVVPVVGGALVLTLIGGVAVAIIATR